jgi:ribulose-phosphate 3-epimerase
MSVIIPAILPTSRRDLEEKLLQVAGITDEVQVDIVDGVFASPPTWPYTEGAQIDSVTPHVFAKVPNLRIETDLMVEESEHITGRWITAGATRILIHLESTTHLGRQLADFNKEYGHDKDFFSGVLSLGIAINVETNLELLEPYIDSIDYVQFMGIKRIGVQGQPFATEVLNKIALFRKKHPNMTIQVDGGVSLESAPLLLGAGVSRLVVGSALWNAPNLSEAFQKFSALTQLHGLYE